MGAKKGQYEEEPAVGVPSVVQGVPLLYVYHQGQAGPYPVVPPPRQWDSPSPEQERNGIPPHAITQNLRGLPIQDTFYGDTSAPFKCIYCEFTGMTEVRSTLSTPAWVACAVSIIGCCFLMRGCNCLHNKHHYCPSCGNEVAIFRKTDPCLFADPKSWWRPSYAFPTL